MSYNGWRNYEAYRLSLGFPNWPALRMRLERASEGTPDGVRWDDPKVGEAELTAILVENQS